MNFQNKALQFVIGYQTGTRKKVRDGITVAVIVLSWMTVYFGWLK